VFYPEYVLPVIFEDEERSQLPGDNVAAVIEEDRMIDWNKQHYGKSKYPISFNR
jgi:hypothetical protein